MSLNCGVIDKYGNYKVTGPQGDVGPQGIQGAIGPQGLSLRDRRFAWFFRNTNGTAITHGVASVTEQIAGTNVSDARNQWRRHTTAATTNSKISYKSSEVFCWADHGPYFSTRIRMGSTITTMRMFIGFSTADPDNADTMTTGGLRTVTLRYSTNASDTGFVPVTWDGTTQTTGTAIGTVVANTEYLIEAQIATGGASIIWSITPAGGTAATQSQNIGSAVLGNALVLNGYVAWTLANSARILDNAGVWCDCAGRND